MALPDALTARLAGLARVAENATAALDLAEGRKELDHLRAPQQITTEIGLRLSEIQAERRAVERAARAAELSEMPDVRTAEMAAAATRKTSP